MLTLRSTVSKIVHQSQYEDVSSENHHAAPAQDSKSPNQAQCLDAQQALVDWIKDQQQKGIPLTRAIVRKKAAIFAAMAWSQNKSNVEGSSASEQGTPSEASTAGLDTSNWSRYQPYYIQMSLIKLLWANETA